MLCFHMYGQSHCGKYSVHCDQCCYHGLLLQSSLKKDNIIVSLHLSEVDITYSSA